MVASGLINEHLLAGLVLVLAFISFAIGASLPLVGKKGNTGFYPASARLFAGLLPITLSSGDGPTSSWARRLLFSWPGWHCSRRF